MLTRVLCAIAVVGTLGLEAEAAQKEIGVASDLLATNVVASGRKSVAVVDFGDLQGNVTELGRFVAEELALGLVVAGKGLTVVDRTHLRVLMKENKLGESGLIDPATARKLGQIIGVDALVTGTITPFADSVRVVVKVLDTSSAQIVAATSIDIASTQTIQDLIRRGAGGSAVPEPVAATPIGVVPPPNAGTPVPPPAPAGAVAKQSFKNQFLQVDLESVGFSSQSLSVSLSLKNIGTEAIYIGTVCCYGEWLMAVDNNGEKWQARNNDITPLPTRVDREFVRLAPGEATFVTAQMKPGRGSAGPPKTVSLTGSMLRRSAEDQRATSAAQNLFGFREGQPFSFGISNIQIGAR